MSTNQTRRKDKSLPGNGGWYAPTDHAEADTSVGLGVPTSQEQTEEINEKSTNQDPDYQVMISALNKPMFDKKSRVIRSTIPVDDRGTCLTVSTHWGDGGYHSSIDSVVDLGDFEMRTNGWGLPNTPAPVEYERKTKGWRYSQKDLRESYEDYADQVKSKLAESVAWAQRY